MSEASKAWVTTVTKDHATSDVINSQAYKTSAVDFSNAVTYVQIDVNDSSY